MLVVANVLLALCGGLALLITSTSKGAGPEGPVGAHMITAPLALGQAIAIGMALALGGLAPLGVPPAVGYLTLPFYFVGMVVLPIAALGPRWRVPARVAAFAGVSGSALLLDGPALLPASIWPVLIGSVGVFLVAGVGFGMLATWFVQSERNRAAVERHRLEQEKEYEVSQTAYELAEWQKLPIAPELWQLIQFTHSRHPEVRAQCRARIAALPDLSGEMQALLGTGWAEHALGFLRDGYPISRAPLTAAFAKVLEDGCEKWKTTLDTAPQPGTWYCNVAYFVDVAEKLTADGGDVSAGMAAWAELLEGKRGLEPLAQRAASLARRT